MLVYVAGQYGNKTAINGIGNGNVKSVDENIAAARKVAIELWEKGYAVICPHLNTSHMEDDCKATWQEYLKGDFEMIARCDALVLVDNWKDSKGATEERDFALSLGIPVYEYPTLPELPPTEIFRPQQSREFLNVVMQMYHVHLSKNNDYSPANILATGEIGLATRLWDKVARLLNLTGFHIEISKAWFSAPIQPKNESIDDTLMDAAVYSVIGLLLRKGVWGR